MPQVVGCSEMLRPHWLPVGATGIDMLVSARRDAGAARRFFRRALATLKVVTAGVVTDAAPAYPVLLDDLIPSACHHVERYANNPVESDHAQLKRRLRPMRGLAADRTAQVIIAGHAFVQNLRRGHYELAVDGVAGAAGQRGFHRARQGDLTTHRAGSPCLALA
jgi:transposase-like protein